MMNESKRTDGQRDGGRDGRWERQDRRRAPNGRVVWTVEEVRGLGVTTNIPTAAEVLGIGRTLGFALFRAGEFPVPVLRIGHRAVVPVAGLLKLLDADTPPGAVGAEQDLGRAS